MATAIPFNTVFEDEPGTLVSLTPRLRRITSPNPSMFTFKGTNTYVVGHGNVGIVDPGPALPEHIDAILSALGDETITHIIATHTHMDHSPGVALLTEHVKAPTYGYGPHGIGARRDWPFDSPEGGDRSFNPDIRVADGDLIEGDGWTLEAVFTPGHISNHLCFALKEDNVLLSGDHVMGWSTSIVSPPDGDMAAYMDSLDKLLTRGETTYYPGHGGPIEDPKPFVEAFIAHRDEREKQILECLERDLHTIPAMVEVMYANVAKELHRAAGRSVLSHLLHMHEKAIVATDDPVPGPDSSYRLA